MGCDIHLFGEVKIHDEWLHYGPLNMERDYSLYSKMAGVRPRDGDVPLVLPKGLPPDISRMTRIQYKKDEGDAHHESWFTAKEIAEFATFVDAHWKADHYHGFFGLTMKELGYIFGNAWTSFHKYPEERSIFPDGLEDIRWIFWFDN